jgi:multidrug efflux pump subunit AcrB
MGWKTRAAIVAPVVVVAGVVAWRLVPRRQPKNEAAIQIVTTAEGLGAAEVESAITTPIERMMTAAPSIARIESVTTPGLSLVRVVLKPNADPFTASGEVIEQLKTVSLPSNVGLPTFFRTGSGPRLTYALVPDASTDLGALREMQDWDVARVLERVPGVGSIEACGGRARRVEVMLDPERLRATGLSADDVADAIAKASGSPFLLGRAGGFARLEDIGPLVVQRKSESVLRVADLATVTMASRPPDCVATRAGKELLIGEISLQPGANGVGTAKELAARLRELPASGRVELLDMAQNA